jgi:hypothetical protein
VRTPQEAFCMMAGPKELAVSALIRNAPEVEDWNLFLKDR